MSGSAAPGTENEPLIGAQTKRRPYHYTIAPIVSSSNFLEVGSPSVNNSTSSDIENWSTARANYSRYLYYNRLRRNLPLDDDDILLIPPHVIPTDFFYPQFLPVSSDGKQSSLITIFAIWNTMMGTSLLSMPWAIEKAGVVSGLTLLILMAGISFYTAFRILEVYEAHENSVITDFAVLCKKLLGKWAQIVAVVFSVLTILGALTVYWVLMSNFLFHTVDFIYTKIQGGSVQHDEEFGSNFTVEEVTDYTHSIYCPSAENATNFSEISGQTPTNDFYHEIWDLHRTVPLFLIVILGPLACIRSPAFFARFNSLGTLSVAYLLIFVLIKGSIYGINVDFIDTDSISYTPIYNTSFPALIGMLSLAFFIHNCVITIMKNNRNQKKNKRDLSIAYFFVALTYFIVGGAFYAIFPLEKSCIEDNFLNNFRTNDLWGFTARIFLFFQMTTVFPLLMYILRVQVTYSITKREPTFPQVILLSGVVICICITFAIWLPRIGTIIRFTGAFCGLVYLFILPIFLYLKWKWNIGQLTKVSAVFHVSLLMVGLVNFVLQFVVTDD